MGDLPFEDETVEGPAGASLGEIGPYRLLQRIGEGGFGTVFEAEQRHPVRRRVALKIIKLGMDTEQVIARFEAERQALAMMDHPHIARVLDAGATPAGRPYFVMELVKGSPITEYCDRERLPIKERLKLFEQVCTAVQHAHTKGVLHRDLKPSNVLVSTEDGQPFARVIDFGVAKATAARLTDKALYTEIHTLVGTPLYMSPEQAAGSPDIDTRTDVYALGVLLYELLTGTTPIEQRAFRESTIAEIARVIREVDPPRPSTRVSGSAETAENAAPGRRTEQRRLAVALRGELDWIVMKAIEKERARRYETANGLVMDVRRYLAGEPVAAAPPSASYRVGKLVRRHRVAVSAGLLVLVTLVAGVVGTSLGLVRAERQRRAAERVSGFLKDLLGGIGPEVARGRDTVLLKELVNTASQRIEKGELDDAPAAEIELRLSIGAAQSLLADHAAAERMLVPALEKARSVFGPRSLPAAQALFDLASLRFEQGRYADAERLARESLEIRRKLLPAKSRGVAEAMEQLAMGLTLEKRAREAEPLQRDAIAILRDIAPSNPSSGADLAMAFSNLGYILRRLDRPADAEAAYREGLEVCRKSLPDPHPYTGTVLNNMATILLQQNKLPEAEAAYNEALSIGRRVHGPDHPSLTATIAGLGWIAWKQGHLEEAERHLRDALAIAREALGPDHPNVGRVSVDLADVLIQKGKSFSDSKRYAEAETALKEADRVLAETRATTPQSRASCAAAMASLYETWGRPREAAEWRRKQDTAAAGASAPVAAK